MSSNKEVRIITILFSLSLVLIASAFLTIKGTFAKVEVNDSLVWDVSYKDVQIGDNKDGKVNVGLNNIDFSTRLDKFGEKFEFITTIENKGNFDAVLGGVDKTDLSKIEVGISGKTGKTYYISDYVSFDVKYYANTDKNNIKKNNKVKTGDKLYKRTSNKVIVTLKLKDKKVLDNDMIEVFNNYGSEFDLDLSINTVYLQK